MMDVWQCETLGVDLVRHVNSPVAVLVSETSEGETCGTFTRAHVCTVLEKWNAEREDMLLNCNAC